MIRRIGDIVLIQLSDIDSNIYLVGDTIIDSGTGFNFTRLYTILKSLGKKFGDIKQVINTHAHFDHIGGNGYFDAASIAVHENDAPIIENADEKGSYADYYDGHLKPRRVDQKLKDGDMIAGMRVIHTPGHTPGSICLLDEKSGILFSGDTIFSDGVGRTDMPGGDDNQLAESVEKISGLKFKRCCPVTGSLCWKTHQKQFLKCSAPPRRPPERDK